MMQREQESRFGPAPSGELRLFREPLSGHCHRVELFIRVLGLKCEMIDIDVQKGEAQSTAFRRLNGLMEVPVLWHGNRLLADSSAILCYLALRFDGRGRWLPRDPYEMSQVQRWLSIAAGELLNGPVTARRIKLFGLPFDEARALRESMRLFRFLDEHLQSRSYLVGLSPTIADIALYTYTAHAPEGGVRLDSYKNICRWLNLIESWPAFVAMRKSAVPTSSL
jgi:glutathione S-transferase